MELKPGYKQTEVGVIPEDWEVSCLGDLAEFITSGSRGWARYYSDSGSLFIRSQNVREGALDLSDRQYVQPPGGAEGERTSARAGDMLITITGNSVGNVAYLNQDLGSVYVSQHVGLVRLGDPSLADYLCRYLSPCAPGNPQIEISQSGQSKPGLNLQNLKDFRLAIPTSPIERDAISKALSDIDCAIERVYRLICKKRDIKQAAMQELLTGKRRLPGFEGAWEVKRLREIAEIRSGGTPSTTKPDFWDGDVPWCTPTDITALAGRKYLHQTARTISKAGLQASSAELIPPQSVIMTSRATIGECAINPHPITTNQGFKNLVPADDVDVEFLYYLMCMQKTGLTALCGGSTFLEIGKKQVSNYQVFIPTARDEQAAIAAVLSEMDAELAALEARRDKTRELKQGMMQELLTGRTRLV